MFWRNAVALRRRILLAASNDQYARTACPSDDLRSSVAISKLLHERLSLTHSGRLLSWEFESVKNRWQILIWAYYTVGCQKIREKAPFQPFYERTIQDAACFSYLELESERITFRSTSRTPMLPTDDNAITDLKDAKNADADPLLEAKDYLSIEQVFECRCHRRHGCCRLERSQEHPRRCRPGYSPVRMLPA
jgi:hypothetical protein